MRIKVIKPFLYMDGHKERGLAPGEYDVPSEVRHEVAKLAIDFGRAVVVKPPMVEKRAPENKVIAPPETKVESETKADKPKPRKYKKRST